MSRLGIIPSIGLTIWSADRSAAGFWTPAQAVDRKRKRDIVLEKEGSQENVDAEEKGRAGKPSQVGEAATKQATQLPSDWGHA